MAETYDVAFALDEGAFLHGLERILGSQVGAAVAQMNLGEVAAAEEFADDELLFEVEHDDLLLHTVDPELARLQRVHVQVNGLLLRHQNEPVHVLFCRVLEIMLFEPAVFDVQNASLLRVSLALSTRK